jgi:hypothetical protein
MNMDPNKGVLITGLIACLVSAATLYFSYKNNIDSSEKSDTTLSNTEESLQKVKDLEVQNKSLIELNHSLIESNSIQEKQIKELREENFSLYNKLSQQSNLINDNITGGDSYPMLRYNYSKFDDTFSVIADLKGENKISINRIEHKNISKEKIYIEKFPKPSLRITDPKIKHDWQQNYNNAIEAPVLNFPVDLVKGASRDISKDSHWNIDNLIQKDESTFTLEAKIITQYNVFVQTTKLQWIKGPRYPELITTELTIKKNNQIIHSEKNSL